MNNYRIEITDVAFYDIGSIKRYIRDELKNRKAAEDIVDKFFEAIEKLETMPERHKTVGEEVISGKNGVRNIPVGNYYIFYRFIEDKSVVMIDRVLYFKREWKNLL